VAIRQHSMHGTSDIDEPRQDEARAELWRSVFESSEDAQLICTRVGRIHEINRKGAQLLGIANPAECAHVSVFDALSPAASKRLYDIFQRAVSPPETMSAITLLSGAGYVRLIVDLQVTHLGGGFWLVAIKDASRRWRMESHVQRLIAAVDSTTDVFFLTDSELKLTFVNAAFQNVTGHTIEDALGRTADFLREPGEAPKIAEYIKRIQEGDYWTGELLNRRSDGTPYPVESNVSPIHDRTGKLLGYVACERDITQKRKMQEQIVRERNFARCIVSSIDSAIYTMDRDYRLTHVNEVWQRFPPQHGWLNLKKEPQTGDSFLDLICDSPKAIELQVMFAAVLRTGHRQDYQVSGPGKHEWLVTISPLKNDDSVVGIIYKVDDQTKIHELQAQLFQSQKMETIGALAAGVAHDFNNLLQVIRGNLTLIAQDAQSQPLDPRFENIEEAAARAADITDQLLSISRASDEKMIVFDFNKIIKEVGVLTQRSARGNISFAITPWHQSLKVRMDANRAHQVLLNLVVNAQDAMPEGGRLTISSKPVTLPQRLAAKFDCPVGAAFMCCSVTDTGMGISAEIKDRIFDPFFTTKEKGKGTGLGLSIVHTVIRQSGGYLEVSSEVGKGATFEIYLPTVDAAITTHAKVEGPSMTKGTGRILVVDDLDLVRDFTNNFLCSAGYEVFVAAEAGEALTILERENGAIDLMFTDFNMPGMSGLELIQEVAARWPAIKFILASGYLDDEERERIVKECGAKILKKPYNVREATALILNVIRAQKAG
jgi:two-component system cell cycle sensor histidine kinase/response regulator CckA